MQPVTNNMQQKVLNVGGNSHDIAIPEIYRNWTHHLLDIDAKGNPDILCDARELNTLVGSQYEAIYCSHNLEHYHYHEVDKVLEGFLHLLKPDGFAHIRVPDLMTLINHVATTDMELTDELYKTQAGLPIRVMDVIYGWSRQIEASGVDFYAHKTGFSQKLLAQRLRQCGFPWVAIAKRSLELEAFAFTSKPSLATSQWLGIPEIK
jgi:hypothetical protein